ncbi:hypothetical protein AB0K09_31610, partial [Streptomyces sp. NPDC049577]
TKTSEMPRRMSACLTAASTAAHACPGARLARAQLGDALAVLAAHRPVVVRARPDRRAALPGWRSLTVRPGGAS